MEKFYKYTKGSKIFKIRYSLDAKELLNHFSYSFDLACYLMNDIFFANSFFVDLVNKDKGGSFGLELSIKTNRDTLSLILNDSITIKSDKFQVTYKYYMWHNEYIATFASLTAFLNNQTIVYEYDNRLLKVQVLYGDIIYSLEVPLETDDLINYNFFRTIKKDYTILDLKKVYENMLYPIQNEYSLKENTVLTIYKRINSSLLEVDKLIIKDGLISSYSLSSIKDNVLVIIKGNNDMEPELIIKNYALGSDINLNEEANKLVLKKDSLIKKKIYNINNRHY